MANTNINKTYASSGTRTKWTWSFWLKRGTITNGDQVISTCHLDNSNQDVIRFGSADDKLDWWSYQSNSYSNGGRLQTNRVFRDCNAWYHIVLRWDSSNSTAGDRMKLYINGVEETSFSTDTNPSSSLNSLMNNNILTEVGSREGGNNYFNGAMAHTQLCDGYAYAASDFGETDSTSGIWVPKTSPSVSYGTNGYFLKYASGATGTDSSGQGNTQTVAGTIVSLKDTPNDNFCTWNPLDVNSISSNDMDYTNIMTTVCPTGNNWKTAPATMGQCTGKFYFEVKFDGSDVTGLTWIGIVDPSLIQYVAGDKKVTDYLRGYAITASGNKGNNGSEVSWATVTFAQNDICCVAVDLTNSKIYFRKNDDAWLVSGDPTSGATGTGSAYTLAQNQGNNINYVPAVSGYGSDAKLTANFGQGYFGATVVASAGTNASGVGTFEFDVPTGYTAFSTKGLNI